MKKYLTIIFIFLASFIIAAANASFSNTAAPQFTQIQTKTQICKDSAFLNHENYVNKENTIIYETDKEAENYNPTTYTFIAENDRNHSPLRVWRFSNSTAFINNLNIQNIKYNLCPRAP